MLEIHSPTISEIAKALSSAQGEFDSAKKSVVNSHFRNKYADLTAVWEALRDILPKYGLCVIQTQMPSNEVIEVDVTHTDKKTGNITHTHTKMMTQILVTTLLHSSGEWFKSYATLILDKANMQGMGSAISYQRRYSLAAICGITQDDDDGNSACKTQNHYEEFTPPPPPVLKKITEDQAKILTDTVALCDDKFKTFFKNFLSENNLLSIMDMSEKTYNKNLSTANKIVQKKIAGGNE